MTRPLIGFFNVETQEEVIREMNDTEFAQYEIDNAAYQAALVETVPENGN
jgi:hypothetical protein